MERYLKEIPKRGERKQYRERPVSWPHNSVLEGWKCVSQRRMHVVSSWVDTRASGPVERSIKTGHRHQ